MKLKILVFLSAFVCMMTANVQSLEPKDSKWSLGTFFHNALGSQNSGFTGEMEFMASKHLGVTAGFGVGLFAQNQDAKNFYFSNGINTHLFPGSRFDFYFGGRGALTTIKYLGQSTISPTINLYLGSSFYITERYFIDAEFGYWIYGYSKTSIPYQDHSSARGLVRLGFMLDVFK